MTLRGTHRPDQWTELFLLEEVNIGVSVVSPLSKILPCPLLVLLADALKNGIACKQKA